MRTILEKKKPEKHLTLYNSNTDNCYIYITLKIYKTKELQSR